MLYVSSRSKTDSYTAHRTLCSDRAPDGGVYLPFQIPRFSESELQVLRAKSFGQIVAEVLNLFFFSKITAWDVDICAGKNPVRIKEISRRILAAECYHNPSADYHYMLRHLYQKLAGVDACEQPTAWAKIAVRIALLFAVYTFIPEPACNSFDICVNTDDFDTPMAARYARKMGLPIRTVICCSKENGTLWDLLQKGEFNTAAAGPALRELVEGLVHQSFGVDETNVFADLCGRKCVYRVAEDSLPVLGEGLAVSVVGPDRITGLVRSVYRTNNCYITADAAVSFGGLQDYRATTGESRMTVILMDSGPASQAASIAAAIGISESEVLKAF